VELTFESLEGNAFVAAAVAPNPKAWEFFPASTGFGPALPETNAISVCMPNAYARLWNFREDSENQATAAAAVRALELATESQAAGDDAVYKERLHTLERFLLEGAWGVVNLPPAAYTRVVYRADRLKNFTPEAVPMEADARFHDIWLDV
jgi:hypothetical protein